MDTPGAHQDIIYHVDWDGRIAFVNSRWDELEEVIEAYGLFEAERGSPVLSEWSQDDVASG